MAVNKQMEKTPMPEQEARVRAGNFEEVALGYTEEQALDVAGLVRRAMENRDIVKIK